MERIVEIKRMEGLEVAIPLCFDCTGKLLQLARFENHSRENAAVIRVPPVNWEFGVPPKGVFHCVLCDGRFVLPIQTLWNYGKTGACVWDGYLCYEFDQENTSWVRVYTQPICQGWFGLDYEGRVCMGDYRFPCGENGYPIVNIRNGIAVDTKGLLTVPIEERAYIPEGYHFILAEAQGQLCITEKRQLLCRGKLVLPGEKMLDACTCRHGYLVLKLNGETRFSTNGAGWQELDDNAVAISGGENTIAIADANGNIFIYQHDHHSLHSCGKLSFPGKQISEISVSDETVIIKFLDSTFDIIDWRTGATCLDDVVFMKP